MTRRMVKGGVAQAKRQKVRKTEVVHVKSGAFNMKDPTHIYIGPCNPQAGFPITSIWANPFKADKRVTVTADRGSGVKKKYRGIAKSVVDIERDGSPEEIVQKYRAWIVQQPDYMACIHELKGKRLGFLGDPRANHGYVLQALADAT